MRTLLVVVAAVVAALIVAAGGFALVVTFAFPRVAPASDVAIERTPERLARGRYLAENVMGCIGCHSPRMEDRYSFPAREGTEGAGGFVLGIISQSAENGCQNALTASRKKFKYDNFS